MASQGQSWGKSRKGVTGPWRGSGSVKGGAHWAQGGGLWRPGPGEAVSRLPCGIPAPEASGTGDSPTGISSWEIAGPGKGFGKASPFWGGQVADVGGGGGGGGEPGSHSPSDWGNGVRLQHSDPQAGARHPGTSLTHRSSSSGLDESSPRDLMGGREGGGLAGG